MSNTGLSPKIALCFDPVVYSFKFSIGSDEGNSRLVEIRVTMVNGAGPNASMWGAFIAEGEDSDYKGAVIDSDGNAHCVDLDGDQPECAHTCLFNTKEEAMVAGVEAVLSKDFLMQGQEAQHVEFFQHQYAATLNAVAESFSGPKGVK